MKFIYIYIYICVYSFYILYFFPERGWDMGAPNLQVIAKKTETHVLM